MAGVSSASDSSRDGYRVSVVGAREPFLECFFWYVSVKVVVEEQPPLERVCDVLVAVVVVVPVVSR